MKGAKAFNPRIFRLPLRQTHLMMKVLRIALILCCATLVLSSCSVFNKNKQGCGDNGKNVGAEKLLDGTQTKKQPKFKA
jgi:hypothetical protein